MKKERIVLDFVRIPVPLKMEFGRNVVAKIKGNSKFCEPDVSIADLEATLNLLEARSVTAKSGGKEATALMHQTEDDLDNLLRKMARYVERVADGDGAILLSAGFNLAKKPSQPVRPEFSVELGEKSGSVLLRRQAVEGAKSYIWQHCIGDTPAPSDADWSIASVSVKVNTEIAGLTPLTKYWFRSAAVLSSGTTAYNSPVMQVVL